MVGHEHGVDDDIDLLNPQTLQGVQEISRQTTARLLVEKNMRRNVASYHEPQEDRV